MFNGRMKESPWARQEDIKTGKRGIKEALIPARWRNTSLFVFTF